MEIRGKCDSRESVVGLEVLSEVIGGFVLVLMFAGNATGGNKFLSAAIKLQWWE